MQAKLAYGVYRFDGMKYLTIPKGISDEPTSNL